MRFTIMANRARGNRASLKLKLNNNNNNNNIKFIQEGICYKHTFIKLHPPV